MSMKIVVVSAWYNEAFLAPFFLSHYAYADKIHLIIDVATTDKTHDICARYSNVEIEGFSSPEGMDDGINIGLVNKRVASLDCDWVYVVDADELVFPKNMGNPRDVLARQTGNLLYVPLRNVYRHITDSDLDPNKPALEQRRHGDPVVHSDYTKPMIAKPETGIQWQVGHHSYHSNSKLKRSQESFQGVHWQSVDVEMAIERRLKGRRDRLSPANIKNKWGDDNLSLTEEFIRAECNAHLNDPQLF